MQTTAIALNQFPIVDTHDAEIMREIMLTQYGAARFEASKQSLFFGRPAAARLGSVSLGWCAYGAPAWAKVPEADFVRMQFAFSGSARTSIGSQTVDVDAHRACVTPAEHANRIEFGADYQQIIIRIQQNALERKLAASAGRQTARRPGVRF
jgi:hypothetical protein